MNRFATSVFVGILITGIPLVLAALFPSTHVWRSAATICDWPMSIVKSANVGRNELTRVIFFFVVNVATWGAISFLVLLGLKKHAE